MSPSLQQRFQTIRTLGLAQTAWYALYRFGLRTGHYRRSSPSRREVALWVIQPLWPLPDPAALLALLDRAAQTALRREAEEILRGQFRMFGGALAPILQWKGVEFIYPEEFIFHDVDSLVAYVREQRDPEKFRRAVADGRRFVQERYAEDRFVENVRALFRELI